MYSVQPHGTTTITTTFNFNFNFITTTTTAATTTRCRQQGPETRQTCLEPQIIEDNEGDGGDGWAWYVLFFCFNTLHWQLLTKLCLGFNNYDDDWGTSAAPLPSPPSPQHHHTSTTGRHVTTNVAPNDYKRDSIVCICSVSSPGTCFFNPFSFLYCTN